MMTLHDLPDHGFANPRGARAVVRRMKMRRALMDAQASIEALIDHIDKGIQADRDTSSARFREAIALMAKDVDGVKRRAPVNLIDRNDMREKELLDGVNVVLQFLDTVGVGLRHGLFSVSGSPRSNPPADAAHRLCGGAK
ncbi:hypothetical protein [Porphyrobacter sp. YT40]|uniref:hypothetical protein n=1 Tax=Porphyrobacter sp. YT40 TaxID=2547601 RepID=UPI00114184F0|nr:hypothetical protein [Porphyrobacter sp. YT40]QDH35816.1 hypothetical protein E2E27_16745 [Porphyrobacter sp. YT40]